MVKKRKSGGLIKGKSCLRCFNCFNKITPFTWVLIFLAIILIGFFIWGNFIYYNSCDSRDCFDYYLSDCERAQYVKNGEMKFNYFIKGRSGDSCVVGVELIESDLGNQEGLDIVGKDMNCYIPYGSVVTPNADLDLCHGELKEGFQDLIITRMHRYIVNNLGEIKREVFENFDVSS